jgi:hypothetical protein
MLSPVRVGNARGPTCLAVSWVLALVLGCSEPNPAYVGLEGVLDPDAADGIDAPEMPVDDVDGAVGVDGGSSSDSAPVVPDASADTAAEPADAALLSDWAAPPDSAGTQPIPTADLVAHWALDEGQGTAARDATGNLNDGTLLNGPTWIADAPTGGGLNPGALHLDGTDDYVELAIQTLPRAEAAKTIGVWFRNSASSPRLRNLVALFSDAGNTGFHLGFETDKVAVWRYGDVNPIIVSSIAPDASWHHLAYSWDGTTHRLYLDGVPIGTSTASVKNGAIGNARLGTWQLPNEMFGGDLDEVRVYSRALSASEIAALATP